LLNQDRVLIFIPAFNESQTISRVVKQLAQLSPAWDVLVVDDGSDDETESEARKSGANVIALPFHAGGTVAVLTAFLYALDSGYSFAVKVDGDCQHRPEDVGPVLQPVIGGEADICVGSRYLGGNSSFYDSSVKGAGRMVSSSLIGRLTESSNLTDSTSGLRAWNKEALQVLTRVYLEERVLPEDSILWLVESIIAMKNRLRMKEVKVTMLPRAQGKSKSFTGFRMVKYPFRLMRLLLEETW
jgi:glycosyltransferase involved in cell wall biosynthesis